MIYPVQAGRPKATAGFTLPEVLVAVFVLAIVTIGVTGLAVLNTRSSVESERQVVAMALVNEKIEFIRSLDFDKVGITGVNPQGVLQAQEIVVRNDQEYTVLTDVLNLDADLKQIRIEAFWGRAGGGQRNVTEITYISRGSLLAGGGGGPPPPPPPPPPTCGNGDVDPGEQCDLSSGTDSCGPPATCQSDCTCAAPPGTEADLTITKRNISTGPGGTDKIEHQGVVTEVSYDLVVFNNGTAPATSVTVTDALAGVLTLDAAQSSSECVQSGNTVTCTLPNPPGQLDPQVSHTFNLVFDVAPTVDCYITSVTNPSSVDAAEFDPNTDDNNDLDTSQVWCNGEFKLKTASNVNADDAALDWTSVHASERRSITISMFDLNSGPPEVVTLLEKYPVDFQLTGTVYDKVRVRDVPTGPTSKTTKTFLLSKLNSSTYSDCFGDSLETAVTDCPDVNVCDGNTPCGPFKPIFRFTFPALPNSITDRVPDEALTQYHITEISPY